MDFKHCNHCLGDLIWNFVMKEISQKVQKIEQRCKMNATLWECIIKTNNHLTVNVLQNLNP